MKVYFKKIFPWLLIVLVVVGCKKQLTLKTTTIQIDSLSQIELVRDSLVKPILYSNVVGLGEKPTNEAKQLFISVILPAILIAKHDIKNSRDIMKGLLDKKNWEEKDSLEYKRLAKRYKASNLETLLRRMCTIPTSIVLAQAAVESGWGKSRFFVEGNNVFGIWSYNSNEPRLQASTKREEGAIHVRAYEDISGSIGDYFKTLGTSRAYRRLRAALQETNDPDLLLPHLKYYSERRLDYVDQLRKIIHQNDLQQYDQYVIDPKYIVPA